MRSIHALAAVVAVVAAACGAGTGDGLLESGSSGPLGDVPAVRAVVATLDVPGCPLPPEGVFVTPWSSAGAIAAVRVWAEVPLDSLLAALEASAPDELETTLNRAGVGLADGIAKVRSQSTVVSLRRAPELYEQWLFTPGLAEALETADSSTGIALVGLGSGNSDGVGYIRNVFLEDADGRFTAVGLCETSTVIASGVARYANETNRASYALLESMAADESALEAFEAWTSGDPVPWALQPADERLLDVEETPSEVLADFSLITVTLEPLPQEWRTFDAVVCTKVAQGWNECSAFDADEPGEDVELLAYARAGEDIEVWLLDEDANLTDPIARLGVFRAAVDMTDGSRLELTVISKRQNLAEVVSDASRGIAILDHSWAAQTG